MPKPRPRSSGRAAGSSAPQRRFLAELPLTLQEDDRLYVHSEASNPQRWRYVQTTLDAARSIEATEAQVTFCGHIHQPRFIRCLRPRR
jgi:diadenosine tetraphosphatase ApaH/serine/threonine PP2A family protein phosphatase